MKTQMILLIAAAVLCPLVSSAANKECRVKEVNTNHFVINFQIDGSDARRLYESLPIEKKQREPSCPSEDGCAPHKLSFYKIISVNNGNAPEGIRATFGVTCSREESEFHCSASGQSYTGLSDLLNQSSSPELASKIFFGDFRGKALNYSTNDAGFRILVDQIGGADRLPMAGVALDLTALACRLN